jgi:membrane dipeptidase
MPTLFDLHEDIALYYYSGEGYGYEEDSFDNDLVSRQADLPKYERANVKLVFSSVFPLMRTFNPKVSRLISQGYGGPNSAFTSVASFPISLELVRIYYEMQRRFKNRIKLVEKAQDLKEIMNAASSTVGFLMALEGTESIAEPASVELLWRLGIRSIQLTWNFDTKYASSCMSENDYGLTGAGKELIQVANEFGIIVDLAHAGRKTCLDTLANSDLPVMITHANCASVYEHKRNVSDEVLDALKRNGGIVGFTLIPDTITKSRRPGVGDIVEHIRYVRENFGSEILGIGTDYFGLFPPDKPPEGLEDISKSENLWRALREDADFSESEIQAISFGNAQRVIEANAKRWRD